ncbi:MAG TPA: HAD-IA family hydrolase [Vicinamibacteria bacterium]|jgi:HAD superfamily hydrolase (TIGR01509 family)|nr:HAD-IA family hydrolase [Vicinamibacteria bacterium]
MFSALVVSGGGFQGLGLIRCLRESAAVRVVLADCFEESISRYFADSFHPVPRIADTQNFLAALLGICEREGVRIVLPSTQHELLALAEGRQPFAARGVFVGVSDPGFLRLAGNKRELYEFLGGAGLPTLPVVDLRREARPFPLIGRPIAGWGSRGTLVLRSERDLEGREVDEVAESHLWQPYLERFEELSVDFALDGAGEDSGFGVRRRARTSGGFAVISETAEDPAVETLMRRFTELVKTKGARGLFNVQLIRERGKLYFSDVNPRIGTSAVHWCGTGFNPALHLCGFVDRRLREGLRPPPSSGRRMVRYLDQFWIDPVSAAVEPARAVVFDVDDTLIHHKRWILGKLERLHEAFPDELPERGLFLLEAARLVEEGPRAQLFDELKARFALGPDLTAQLVQLYRASVPHHPPVFPDVAPTLASLKRSGLKLAVLTDNPPESQRLKLEASGLSAWFDVVVYSREAGAEKPSPEGFAVVAERLGIPARALVMVGDNPYRDVLGAARAGYGACYLLRRAGGFFNFDPSIFKELSEDGPEFRVIDTLQGLLPFLGASPAGLSG